MSLLASKVKPCMIWGDEVDTLHTMLCAALGHDLLEDTVADKWLLKHVDYGAFKLICELTNPNDDAHTDEYKA